MARTEKFMLLFTTETIHSHQWLQTTFWQTASFAILFPQAIFFD
jgi:hypothetical protein